MGDVHPAEMILPMTTSPASTGTLLDPGLAAYELLRRMIAGRSPFSDWLPEPGRIPEDLQGDIEFAVQSYQLHLFLAAAGRKYGRDIEKRIFFNLLLWSGVLSGVDLETIESYPTDGEVGRRLSLIDTFLVAKAHSRSASLGVGDPEVHLHMALAVAVMRVFGWPEERQNAFLMLLGECLHRGLIFAQISFNSELDATAGIAENPAWSEQPGPFERQLQRQCGNPLFPAADRMVTGRKIENARKADLRLASQFLQSYKAIHQETVSLRGKKATLNEIFSYLKTTEDLLTDCRVLGAYFSPEEKVLEAVSEAANRLIVEGTKEPRIQDLHEERRALSREQVFLRKMQIAIPPEVDKEDYTVRSILSEDVETISNYGLLVAGLGMSTELARKIVVEAIRDGMDSDVAKKKLDAYAGMQSTATEACSGRWSIGSLMQNMPRCWTKLRTWLYLRTNSRNVYNKNMARDVREQIIRESLLHAKYLSTGTDGPEEIVKLSSWMLGAAYQLKDVTPQTRAEMIDASLALSNGVPVVHCASCGFTIWKHECETVGGRQLCTRCAPSVSQMDGAPFPPG